MRITAHAEQDIDQQKEHDRKKLAQKIKEKLSSPRDKDEIKYISKPSFNVEFHRLKIKEEGLDHRAYFDYKDSEIVVFAVRHRDHSYTTEDLKETQKRKNSLDP